MFKWFKREVQTENGIEVVVEKRYNLFKDQWQNRLFVFQPQDPVLKFMDSKIQWA